MIQSQKSMRGPALLAIACAFLMTTPALAQVPSLPSEVDVDVPFQAATTLYAEDFELDDGGFTTGGSASWAHGMPSSPPVPEAGQGPAVWGTNLNGDYGKNECGWIQSPAIDLSGVPAVADADASSVIRLAFRHWLYTERSFDAGVLMASADGESWTVLTPTGGYDRFLYSNAEACFGLDSDGMGFTNTAYGAPAEDAWRLAEFDLTAYAGGDVHLRWVFSSDSFVEHRGWYVDDVVIETGAGAFTTVPVPETPGGVDVPFTPLTTVYAEDFEADDGGWTATGSAAWEWGSPVAPPAPTEGGFNAWGTNMFGDYPADACGHLTSPVISLAGAAVPVDATVAELSFKLWRHTDTYYDGAVLQASTDGGASWALLVPNEGYDRDVFTSGAATAACLGVGVNTDIWNGPTGQPGADEWMDVTVDVSRYLGSDVMFRFAFGSVSFDQFRGVYVDDVLVQTGAGASATLVDPSNPAAPSATAPGWTITGENPSWGWGVPTEGPTTTRPTWGTNLNGDYNNNECSAIVSPAIDTNLVPGLGRLTLTFEHHMSRYSTLDAGIIQVSNDGGATWDIVTPVGGYDSTLSTTPASCLTGGDRSQGGFDADTPSGYHAREVNLNQYAGDTIQVRFAFASSSSGQDDGWFIRNVGLSKGLGVIPLAAQVGSVEDVVLLADPALRAAIGNGVTEDLEVLVVGEPIDGVADQDFATRTEAAKWLREQSAPLLTAFTNVAEAAGADVLAEWAYMPGIKVRADLPALQVLAATPGVRQLTLDSEDAVQLIEPLPDESVDASNSEGRNMLQAEDIWALGYRGEGITVTMIDTGIDARHEAFKYADGSTRVAAFADCVSSGCDDTVAPFDDHGHGTHVAGTTAGSSLYDDPTFGYYQETGVAPEATLKVAKFLSGSGSGSFQGAVDALTWSFDEGSDLTSNSWGASGCSSSAHAVMQTVRTLTDAGMLSVFAAGNSGPRSGTIGSPACSESTLSVGAIDVNENIASFSSRGPCTDTEIGGESRVCPDVVAKGVAVRSAIPRDGASFADASGYRTWQGTSMATPHVAGAVILAEQMKRDLTGTGWDTAARAEEEVFKLTAKDLGEGGEDSTFGWGLPQLLNIYALLDSTDEARIVSSFGISADTIRQGDSTVMRFGVRNLGGAAATGDFTATLTGPDGTVTTLKESTVSLSLLDGESVTHTLVVAGDVLPGDYTFTGTFDYSWTNATTGEEESGSVFHEGSFSVKRVFVDMSLQGLDAETLPGTPQAVTFTATNTGNEDASDVVIEFTVPDDYVFLPGEGFDPANPNSRYADPAPNRVTEDDRFGRVILRFDVGTLAEGESWSFTTDLLPTLPGDYRFVSVARFVDGGGNGFTQGEVTLQSVTLPTA